MAFPTYTIADLSTFSGRPEPSYPSPYTESTALVQALLLFKMATCLTDWPTDPDQAQLAKFAVLELADQFVLSQPYTLINNSPFQSESIGSYSYSKAQKAIKAGTPLGLGWFDLAVGQLGVCELGGLTGGGISSGSIGVFEDDATFGVKTGDTSGKRYVLGPSQLDDEPEDGFYRSTETVQGPRHA